MVKKIKKVLNSLNLNFQKEIKKIVIIDILFLVFAALFYFFFQKRIIIIFSLLLLFCITILYFYRYKVILETKKDNLINEFIENFSYLRIYLSNNETVYQALNSIKENASFEIKSMLNKLINEIDSDKTITPFLNFSKNFDNKVVEEVVISLYEVTNEGGGNIYINQFIKIFEDFKKIKEESNKTKRYKSFNIFTIFSLLASGYLMILLVFSVMNLMGEISQNGF